MNRTRQETATQTIAPQNNAKKGEPVMNMTRTSKTKSALTVTLSLAAALAWTSTVSAALIAEDSFDYSVNGLAGNGSAGDGWAGGWTGDGSVTSPGFDYTDSNSAQLITAGNKATLEGPDSGHARGFRTLASTQSPAVDQPLWIGAIMQRHDNSPDDNDRAFSLAFLDNNDNVLFHFGQNNDDNRWWILSKGDPDLNDDHVEGYAEGTSTLDKSFLVVRLSTDGNDETLDLFVNPDLDTAPTGSGDITISDSIPAFLKVRLWAGGGDIGTAAATADFDELRIGTIFGDVAPIPEPASALLLALGAVALLKRRPRRG